MTGSVVHHRIVALVLGGAQCVWEDLEAARALCTPDWIVAINDIGLLYTGHIDIWVSYHSDLLARWAKKRAAAELAPPGCFYIGVARRRRPHVSDAKVLNSRGGSSGLLATYAALKEGATHVILVGVPIDPTMRHITDKAGGKPWADGRHYQMHWKRDYGKLRHKVRSMSGFTRHLLGAPTLEWLSGPAKQK